MNGDQEKATQHLRDLVDALRKLQEPHGDVFWRLEEQITRLEDEIARRSS